MVVPNIGSSYLIGSSTLRETNGYPSHLNNMNNQTNYSNKYSNNYISLQNIRFHHGSGSIRNPSFALKTWRSSEPKIPYVAFLRKTESINSISAALPLNSPLRFSESSDFKFPEIGRLNSFKRIIPTFQFHLTFLFYRVTWEISWTSRPSSLPSRAALSDWKLSWRRKSLATNKTFTRSLRTCFKPILAT